MLDPLKSSLYEIDKNYFPYPWPKNVWEEIKIVCWKGNYLACGYVALLEKNEQGDIIAYALVYITETDDTAALLKLVVKPDHVRCGIATKLLRQTQEIRPKIYLEVDASGEAGKFYQQLGLREINYIRKFYSNGHDARVYLKE
jgi:ribosomal protein S18 acetylase RimI-like enzyme